MYHEETENLFNILNFEKYLNICLYKRNVFSKSNMHIVNRTISQKTVFREMAKIFLRPRVVLPNFERVILSRFGTLLRDGKTKVNSVGYL